MRCLDENSIVAFFAGRPPADAIARVDEHIAECQRCRDVLAEYAPLAGASETRAHVGGYAQSAENFLGTSETTRAVIVSRSPPHQDFGLARRISVAQAQRRLGQVLGGKWRLDRLIGIGGMAQVFEGTHRNGWRVALKLLRPELAIEPTIVERFLREGYLANRVQHPGAVAVLDDDLAPDGVPFLVMELLVGSTLREKLDGKPVDARDALGWIEQVLDVLAAAHDHGIIHRDVKPDNLFLTDDGTLKVLDFGIARLREQMGTLGTQSGVTLGTIGYMPPEQARASPGAVDARSDVWSVGATLFTLLTGRVPHDASSPNEALVLAMTKPVTPVRKLDPQIPPAVAEVLDKALAFEKEARFADCRAMQAAVCAARARSLRPPLMTLAARRRHRVTIALAVPALLAAASLTLLQTGRHSAPMRPAVASPDTLFVPPPAPSPAAASSASSAEIASSVPASPPARPALTTADRPRDVAVQPQKAPSPRLSTMHAPQHAAGRADPPRADGGAEPSPDREADPLGPRL
jgi:serine/threonine protein kinase